MGIERRAIAVVLAAAAAVVLTAQTPPVGSERAGVCPDPFDFLGPSIEISARDRGRLASREPLIRVLKGEGREVAVLGAVMVDFDGDRLAAWMHRIEELKKSDKVPAVGRFSSPPTVADVADLTLEDKDLQDLRTCRVGSCDLKLTADEITRLQPELAALGRDWKPAAEDAFRRVLAARVAAYRAGGLAALGTYADGHSEDSLVDISRMLLDRSPYLLERAPDLVDAITRYPNGPPAGSDSFIYWSTDRFGGRPVTSATHVTIVRPGSPKMPDAMVVGRQIFATHYQNGSLSLTLLLRGCPGPPNYLVYISRSEVDVILGLLGWLTRRIIQGRVEDEAGNLLTGLRDRLSRPPPGGSAP